MPDSDSGRRDTAESDPKTKKVIFGKYELGRLLGRGAFAKVYQARNLVNSHSVAVKIIPKPRLSNPSIACNITREVSILRRLGHAHIIGLHEVLASRSKIYLVLELAKGGELFSRIEQLGRLPEHLARNYFQQLISAVGYCHTRGVFHRDLKPENLLLDGDGDLKVSDFGLSALSSQARPDALLHTLCGTPAYVAPEILAKNGYDGAKVDVWSCGVILFALVAGYLPFNDSNLMSMYRKIYRGEYRVPKWASPDLKRLISRMLDTNPETRVTVDEITRDPWFRKGLERGKWTAMMGLHEEDEDDEIEGRELNAFDLISFSTGANLSGLFESVSDRERFVSGEAAEGILGRAEEVGRAGGFCVETKGQNGNGRVLLRGLNGNLAVRVGVRRLTGGYVVVEVDKGRDELALRFWRDKLLPVLMVNRLMPVVRPSSGRPPALT